MTSTKPTRTAPGWEERTVTLAPLAERDEDGAGATFTLRPGFSRLAALLDVTAFGGGSGLSVWLQHSPDGTRWLDAGAFAIVSGIDTQVLWQEAQPEVGGLACPILEGELAHGTSHGGFLFSRLRVRWTVGAGTHTFGVDLVAIYPT